MGTDINDFGRVSALSAQSQALLTELGRGRKSLPTFKPYTAMQVWDGEGTGSVHFSAADLHVPALGHIVENEQTQWALRQCVEAQPNIQIFAQKCVISTAATHKTLPCCAGTRRNAGGKPGGGR